MWVVFDFLVKYRGILLNDIFYIGLDFINSLLGILLRFCWEFVVVMGDIFLYFVEELNMVCSWFGFWGW